MAVTDSSDATSYNMKAVDLTSIKDDMGTTGGSLATLTFANAAAYTTTLSSHINTLAGHRANVGANISRLNMVESQLAVYGENLAAANSRIADVDVAQESANYAKQQILVQSGTAMLAQANLLSQSALRLLQ
jgi:flagellin